MKASALTLGASAALGTAYNPVLGTVSETLSQNASAGWTYEHFGVTATVGASSTLFEDEVRTARLQVEAGRR